MPTIYDVARHAGVSAATVSRVLNGRATVDAALVERVRAAVDELGYRRNSLARNLRRSSTTLWAVIISDVENPFFTSLVRGIEDVAQEAGYSVVLCNSDENLDKEAAYITAVLGEQVAGVIISPASETATDVTDLLKGGTPVVAVDRRPRARGIDTVLVDNVQGAYEATAHLLEQGYERVACLTGPEGATTADQRLEGYCNALRSHGYEYSPSLVCRADFRERGGFEATLSLLDGDPCPDGLFVANNLMTVGALEALAQRRLSTPQDLGLVCFDEIPWADLIRPSLTTVAQPAYEIGRRAGELLARRIADPTRPAGALMLSTELKARESSSRP
jgi:LacI family transcriptional regulator